MEAVRPKRKGKVRNKKTERTAEVDNEPNAAATAEHMTTSPAVQDESTAERETARTPPPHEAGMCGLIAIPSQLGTEEGSDARHDFVEPDTSPQGPNQLDVALPHCTEVQSVDDNATADYKSTHIPPGSGSIEATILVVANDTSTVPTYAEGLVIPELIPQGQVSESSGPDSVEPSSDGLQPRSAADSTETVVKEGNAIATVTVLNVLQNSAVMTTAQEADVTAIEHLSPSAAPTLSFQTADITVQSPTEAVLRVESDPLLLLETIQALGTDQVPAGLTAMAANVQGCAPEAERQVTMEDATVASAPLQSGTDQAGAVMPEGQSTTVGLVEMVPFSEQELAAFYCNSQLDANAVFVDNFILQSKQENHPLYALLLQYLKANLALTTTKKAVEGYQKDFGTNQPLIWTVLQKDVTSSGKCADNTKVSHTHVYNYAVFNPDAVIKANSALKSLRETLENDLCMRSYSSQLARIHVVNYLHRLVQSIPDVGPNLLNVTSWVPHCIPGQTDRSNLALRDCISVLFAFQRRPPQDQQFSEDCMQWLDMLLSILLRVATLSDHQFILNHLLRCPPGVGRWGAKYVQISSPLHTDFYLAPFRQRAVDAYNGEEQEIYAREWGVGQGLHQDWGGPLLDHFVTMLANLLLPVKQREEFLILLAVPHSEQTDESQSWTFIDDSLEENETAQQQMLLKESDLMAFFDQFPFGDMYQHILQIKNGEFYAEHCSSYAMLRLIAFCTCLIRLLGAAFVTRKLLRYKEFIKRVGKTIRQTVAYVGDHWLGYKSHRTLSGDSMDCTPQGPGEDYYRYSLSRLQLEFDQFVLRATQWILTAHKLGAWQFLADLPYASVSLWAIWRMFWCLYSTPKDGSSPALLPGTEGPPAAAAAAASAAQQETLSTVEQIVESLKSALLKDQFLDLLMTAYTSEAIFLLTTFANMARARPSTSTSEKLFINTIAVDLFYCTQVASFAKEAYSHTGRSLLGSIAIVHPFVMTTLIERTEEAFKNAPEENCLQLFRELPLSLWQPGIHEIHLVRAWLVQHPPSSIQNQVARVILSGLNWGTRVEDGSNELVLDPSVHKSAAILIVEAHSQHLPTHPGGRQYTPMQGIRKYASSFISGLTQEQSEFLSWAWEVALMLKLHPNQLSHCTTSLLNPTSPSSPARHSGTLKSLRTVGDEAPDGWFLPPLTATEELADLRDAVKYGGHLAFYIALCMTSVGSDTDEFISSGLKMLDTLIEEGYYLPVLRIVANITPRFFQLKKPLLADPLFLQVVMALASADVASVSLREKLTFSLPQPLVSRKMGALIVTQLQRACGPGGAGGDTVLQFWLDTFLSFPNWWKEHSLLYLMDIMAQFIFTDVSLLKLMQKALLESYYNVQSGSTRRGSFITTMLSAVGAEGPPSIFNSIALSSFPWLAFCSLCAEEQYEMEEGIWKALLLALKNDTKITIDAALKRVLTDQKATLFPVTHLSIYRWAEFCAAVDIKEPVAVLAWQKFFILYLQRPVLQGSMPERDSQGWKFFSTPAGTALKRKLKGSLSSSCSSLKTSLTAMEQRTDDSLEPVNESASAHLTGYLKYYQTLRLWLDEPRLHDPALYIPALPQSYDPSRLESLIQADRVSLWFELMPFDEIKGQLNALVQEWVQVAAYQKTLPFMPESSGSQIDTAFQRIQKRLLKCSKPALAPPPLQIIAAPFVTVPDDILISRDAFLSVLSMDLQFIVLNARSFITKSSLLTSLDDEYITAVPELYSNPPRQFHVQVACRQAQNRAYLCTGPATLIFRVEEMALHPKWDHRLRMNRAQYEETVIAMTTPVAHDMCMAVMRMEHNVARLVQLAHQMQDSSVNLALKCGVSVFYEVLKYVNIEARLFPPTCQFFTTCVQVLGQEFVHRDPAEIISILPTLLTQPALADLLSPLFEPNRCDQSFLSMYGSIVDVARNVGTNIAFSLLTKFNIPLWLDSHDLSMSEGNQFMEYIGQGLVFCGADLSCGGSGKELLVETYRQHFRLVLNHNFPQQFNVTLRLLMEGVEQHNIIPSIWVELCSALASGHLSLQQLHDTLQFVTAHYLQKRLVEDKSLYSMMHWYVPAITEFLQQVCASMVAGWKESVDSCAVKVEEAVTNCWEAIRNAFEPWVTSPNVGGHDVWLPCTESESVMMNSVMAIFVNCIATLHTTLKGGTLLLASVWQYYCKQLAIITPEYILGIYHANLVKLPWKHFFPDLSVLDQMAKFKTDDLFQSSSIVFVSKIFSCLDWKHIISAYCDMGSRGDNMNLPIQLHVKLLQLLIMFAAEEQVMNDSQSAIPELINEAHEFHWEFLDSQPYHDIIEWQKCHCDPHTVLQAGSNLSVASRLLKAAAEFPVASGSKMPPTQNSWKKRHMYVQVVVELISVVTKKPDAHNFSYSDVLSPLFETIVNIGTYECSDNDSENIITLTGEVLNLLNICSPVPSVVQKLVDLIFVILDELPSAYVIALPIVTAGCRSLASLAIMAKLVEHAIECHFRAQPKPLAFSLRLPREAAQYGWQRVAASLVLPESSLHEFLQICVSECSILVLHAYILQKLYSGRSAQQEMEVAIQVVQWCSQVKPKSKEEAKLFLLWEKAINILLIQARTSYSTVVPYVSSLATVLSRSGEDKATEGILGVIGLGKKSVHSFQFRIISRAMAAFLFCQMPVDSSQTTQLRLYPESPGHIKDVVKIPPPGAVVPTKMGEQSYNSLEQLLSNKQYAAWKELAAYSVSFTNDSNNTLVNAVDLLVHLCTALFPEHRYLDILRTVG